MAETMAKQAAIAIDQSQFLHVTIDLPAADKLTFVAGMRKLVPLFTRPCPASGTITAFGWPLVASMTNTRKGKARFLHLWKMANPARPLISEVMEVCGADKNYGALDQLVDVEVQDIMHTNDSYSPRNWPVSAPKAYVHEMLDMTSDVGRLVAFENAMPVVALQMQEKFGWTLLLAMLSNTGKLRRFVHFWQIRTPAPAAVAAATKFLCAQPAYARAIRARDADVFQAVGYGRRSP